MTLRLLNYISIILLFGLTSCRSTNKIIGTYQSKFASNGFFGTTIRLKPDNTLEYIFQGDLMYDSVTGHYRVRDKKVFIIFDKELQDTNKMYYRYDDMELKTIVLSGDTIAYKTFCYIGHNKLFPGHLETGKKVTTAFGYSRRKKYLFFGSNYYNKRYYYKRMD